MSTPRVPSPPSVSPWSKARFRERLEKSESFLTSVELVTSRGLIIESRGKRVLALARELAHHPDVDVLSITDNPAGNAMISADTFGTDLISRGQEVIIHLSCKDWNRNALQSRGWKLASEGFDNVLALSGDYPSGGHEGRALPVFDIDSVGLLQMFSEMNRGLRVSTPRGEATMERTHFFLGAVVTNFKKHEREVMPQYFKLAKKIEAGAGFIINQIGYDSRKMDELLKYMAMKELNVPVLGNVYVLSGPAARFMAAGNIPGVVITEGLADLAARQAQSPDKGKAFFHELAAKQIAVMKGLGFRGCYLGGHLKLEDYERIFERVRSFSGDDWKSFAKEIRFSQTGEFYFFEEEAETGLSSQHINREYLASRTPEAREELRRRVPVGYKFSRMFHEKVFEKGSPGFQLGRRIYTWLEQASPATRRAAHSLEQGVKTTAFDCRDCGDCSLPDIAYLCPESQCVKNQRNGPCGGTRQGKCEVGEKDCIWARAYDRLKAYGEEEEMLERPMVFKDGSLQGTSAWGNAFLERDHRSRKQEG